MTALGALITKFKKIQRINLSECLEPVQEVLLDAAREAFRTGGRSNGEAWAGYGGEPKYAAYKKALGASPQPLRWVPGSMERLYPSLTNPRDSNHLWRLSGGKATFGSTLPYIAKIESGGVNQFGERFPGRKILPINQSLRDEVVKSVKFNFYRAISRTSQLSVENK